jgi:hypothetical protein
MLINSEPIEQPPDPMMVEQAMMMGMPPPPPVMLPSIPADLEVDIHSLEADICRRWLVSDAGRLCKIMNPPGYENVLLHMKMHRDMDIQKQTMDMQKQMMAQGGMMPPQPPGQGAPAQKPPTNNAGVQLEGDQYAPTVS